MRTLTLIILVAALSNATPADARLFRQTYGAIVATEGGCTWNSNQDYFVPRYSSSCHYGLFSPCKSSHTTSPACRRCHAIYPGYCSIYGPLHYCWRNHVYRVHCGCSGICPYRNVASCECRIPFRRPFGPGDCGSALATGCGLTCQPALAIVPGCGPLANVEPPHFHILGSIPVEDGGLLAGAAIGSTGVLKSPLLPAGSAQPVLPSLGRPPMPSLPPSLRLP